jgi:hypothetical protein
MDVAGERKPLRRYGKGLSSEEELRKSKAYGEEEKVNTEFRSVIVSKVSKEVTSAVVAYGRKTVR